MCPALAWGGETAVSTSFSRWCSGLHPRRQRPLPPPQRRRRPPPPHQRRRRPPPPHRRPRPRPPLPPPPRPRPPLPPPPRPHLRPRRRPHPPPPPPPTFGQADPASHSMGAGISRAASRRRGRRADMGHGRRTVNCAEVIRPGTTCAGSRGERVVRRQALATIGAVLARSVVARRGQPVRHERI